PTIPIANKVRRAKGKAPQRRVPLVQSPSTPAAPSRPRPRPRPLPMGVRVNPASSSSSNTSMPDPLDLFSSAAASTALHEDLEIDLSWLSSPGLPPVSQIMRNHPRGPTLATPPPPPYTQSAPFPGPSITHPALHPPPVTGPIILPALSAAPSIPFPYPGLDPMATPLRDLPSLPSIPPPTPQVVIPAPLPADQMAPFVSYPWKKPPVSGYDVYMEEEDFKKLMSAKNYNCMIQFHNFIQSGNYCNMGRLSVDTLTMNGKHFISLTPNTYPANGFMLGM
ncbi:hypothetical protein BDN72DRAFT_866496, partial [Pluteus cervinus]